MVKLLKVKVSPVRSIPGILEKNKNITSEMVLELNKREIQYCMRYGVVYDMDGKLVDDRYLNAYFDIRNTIKTKPIPVVYKPEVVILDSSATIEEELSKPTTPEHTVITQYSELETVSVGHVTLDNESDEPNEYISVSTTVEVGHVTLDNESDEPNEYISVSTTVEVEEHNESVDEDMEEDSIEETPVEIEEDIKEVYSLDILSCEKEDNYVLLTAQFNNSSCSNIEGNIYGLFTIVSGTRPSMMEFLVDGNWAKFNNKFYDFAMIENGEKFVFRLTPKNNNKFRFKLSLKESGNLLVSVDKEINPNEL